MFCLCSFKDEGESLLNVNVADSEDADIYSRFVDICNFIGNILIIKNSCLKNEYLSIELTNRNACASIISPNACCRCDVCLLTLFTLSYTKCTIKVTMFIVRRTQGQEVRDSGVFEARHQPQRHSLHRLLHAHAQLRVEGTHTSLCTVLVSMSDLMHFRSSHAHRMSVTFRAVFRSSSLYLMWLYHTPYSMV